MADFPLQSPQTTRFIDPQTLTRIASLELIARTVVEGFISGLHRSPHLGFSVNFAEYRAYRPGDDIRKIDWKVYGRTDRFFVKEYEGETNTSDSSDPGLQPVHGLSEARGSPSWSMGNFWRLPWDTLPSSKGMPSDSFPTTSDIVDYIPARGSIGHLNTVLHAIERAQAGEKTDFYQTPGKCFGEAAAARHRGGDFRSSTMSPTM